MFSRARFSIFLFLATAGTALAHTPSESFSRWSWHDGRLEIVITVDAREASRAVAGASESRLDTALRGYLANSVGPEGGECEAGDALVLPAQSGWMRVRLSWMCSHRPDAIRVDAFFDRLAEHQHFASSADGEGQQLLSTESRSIRLSADPGSADGVSPSYWLAGLAHIRTGYDHLVFLLTLVLMFRRIREVCIAVTGFTAGHALSMLLLSLDVVAVRSTAVESLIGLSICLGAIEYFRGRSSPMFGLGLMLAIVGLIAGSKLFLPVSFGWGGLVGILLVLVAWFGIDESNHDALLHRYAMVVCFGCLHGFGFASGFMALGVPADEILAAVLRFNLGVEAGQLLFVILAACVIRLPFVQRRNVVPEAIAAACFAAGSFWFVARSVL